MGTPLPPVNDGDPCTSCWGPGKDFGDIATPDVIKLQLTSQLPGEFFTPALQTFLLQTHWLEQFSTPCHYRIEANDFRFDVLWFPIFTVVQIVQKTTTHGVFDNPPADPCLLDIENNLQNPIGTIMFGGFANITFV